MFTLSPASNILLNYATSDTPIKFSQCHQDIGIIVNEKLSWSKHYNYISLKAYTELTSPDTLILSPSAPVYIKTNLYIMLVRIQLTYCSQLWRPRLIKDIKCINRVQHRATKFFPQNYSSNYKVRPLSLELLPLMYWLELRIFFTSSETNLTTCSFKILCTLFILTPGPQQESNCR